MRPNTSRSHLLPGMLEAVLSDVPVRKPGCSPTRSSLCRIRSIVPTILRGWIAHALPNLWALELAARLELRDVNCASTRGFVMPNDDAGYIRLNLRGRERDGIVEPAEADALLDRIATGFQTFHDIDGRPLIQKIFRSTELGFHGSCTIRLPDLIVQWSDRVVTPLAGVASSRFGEVAAPEWEQDELVAIRVMSGRSSCRFFEVMRAGKTAAHRGYCSDGMRRPRGLDRDGLGGQSLLKLRTANNAAEKMEQSNLETRLNRKNGKTDRLNFA